LKLHQKACRSRIQFQQTNVAAAKSPGGGHVPLGAASFQTVWRLTRTAKRTTPQIHPRCRYRLAERSSPLGAQVLVTL